MRSFLCFTLGILLLPALTGCRKKSKQADTPVVVATGTANAQGVAKTNPQKVYVHYMPWFEDPSTLGTGQWGYHWRMNNKNPNTILTNGRRDIASWFYPMIGTYASSDAAVIDYHFLLMKYAGIDGIIVDWYGSHNVYDYAGVRRNTDSLFSRLPATHGLEFSICYEDATLNSVLTVSGTDKITAAKQDFAYLQDHYFSSSNYVKINSKPLLLCFGPQAMTTPANWQSAFSDLSTQPYFLALQGHQNLAGSSASGSFAWPQASNTTNLNNFYTSNDPANSFGSAYPGFKDFYAQGGGGSTLFLIGYDNTLQTTLELSKSNNVTHLQIATWNDYGEGTMIEPTLDYNFSSLTTIQQYTGVSYTAAELQLIYKWYTLRKSHAGDATIQAKLLQAFNLLVTLKVTEAHAILDPMS